VARLLPAALYTLLSLMYTLQWLACCLLPCAAAGRLLLLMFPYNWKCRRPAAARVLLLLVVSSILSCSGSSSWT
jgi:hypothetical protein